VGAALREQRQGRSRAALARPGGGGSSRAPSGGSRGAVRRRLLHGAPMFQAPREGRARRPASQEPGLMDASDRAGSLETELARLRAEREAVAEARERESARRGFWQRSAPARPKSSSPPPPSCLARRQASWSGRRRPSPSSRRASPTPRSGSAPRSAT
jgi:hypothetical protein